MSQRQEICSMEKDIKDLKNEIYGNVAAYWDSKIPTLKSELNAIKDYLGITIKYQAQSNIIVKKVTKKVKK